MSGRSHLSIQLGTAIGRIWSDAATLAVAVATIRDARGARVVLVSADSIWFPDTIAGRLREEIARKAGIDGAAIILAASHTHGSPQPEPRFPFGRSDPAWAASFERVALATAERALASPHAAVSLHFGRARVHPPVAINRRREAWYREGLRIRRRVQSLPNAARAIDDSISVLVARDSAQAIRGIIVHAVCHPVTLPRDAAGADFPGVVRARLQDRYGPHVPVLFLQGHCGDVRPRLVHEPAGFRDNVIETLIGPRFRDSHAGDTEAVGIAIADAAAIAIAEAKELEPSLGSAHVRIPLEDDTGAPVGRELDVTAWRIAPELQIVASSGEMLSGLASQDPRVLSVGYANGMVGYVAPEKEYAGGGYEIDGFLKPFGLKRRFSPDTERRFVAERAGLLARLATNDVSTDRSVPSDVAAKAMTT